MNYKSKISFLIPKYKNKNINLFKNKKIYYIIVMKDEFRVIKDFENYEVSNFGNVKNIKTERILKPGINRDGYYHVILCKRWKNI